MVWGSATLDRGWNVVCRTGTRRKGVGTDSVIAKYSASQGITQAALKEPLEK